MLQQADPYERQHVIPNHLGKATEFVVAHIPTKNCPRGITVDPDGKYGLRGQLAGRLRQRDRPGRMQGGRSDRPRRPDGDHQDPLRRAALPQRQRHFPPPVLLPLLPSRRPHRRADLRHRGRRHRQRSRSTTARSAASSTRRRSSGRASIPASVGSAGPAARGVLHPHAAVHARAARRRRYVHLHDPAPAEPLPARRRPAHRRPAPRQGDVRADPEPTTAARSPSNSGAPLAISRRSTPTATCTTSARSTDWTRTASSTRRT